MVGKAVDFVWKKYDTNNDGNLDRAECKKMAR